MIAEVVSSTLVERILVDILARTWDDFRSCLWKDYGNNKRFTFRANSWSHWPFRTLVIAEFVIPTWPSVILVRKSDVTHGRNFLFLGQILLIWSFEEWILYYGLYWHQQRWECCMHLGRVLLDVDACHNQDQFFYLFPFLLFWLDFFTFQGCYRKNRS